MQVHVPLNGHGVEGQGADHPVGSLVGIVEGIGGLDEMKVTDDIVLYLLGGRLPLSGEDQAGVYLSQPDAVAGDVYGDGSGIAAAVYIQHETARRSPGSRPSSGRPSCASRSCSRGGWRAAPAPVRPPARHRAAPRCRPAPPYRAGRARATRYPSWPRRRCRLRACGFPSFPRGIIYLTICHLQREGDLDGRTEKIGCDRRRGGRRHLRGEGATLLPRRGDRDIRPGRVHLLHRLRPALFHRGAQPQLAPAAGAAARGIRGPGQHPRLPAPPR